MQSSSSFLTDKTFSDPTHFPYGFARSGEFTVRQAQLIEEHGQAYKALSEGVRQPVNDEESEFVRFCQGEKEAESIHERTWKRYLAKLERTGIIYSLAKGRISERELSDLESV